MHREKSSTNRDLNRHPPNWSNPMYAMQQSLQMRSNRCRVSARFSADGFRSDSKWKACPSSSPYHPPPPRVQTPIGESTIEMPIQ